MDHEGLLLRSVVKIAIKGSNTHLGTGFFVNNRLILTCAHVIENRKDQELIATDPRQSLSLPVEIFYESKDIDKLDLAILQLKEDQIWHGDTLPLGSDYVLNDDLYTFGYPGEKPMGDSGSFNVIGKDGEGLLKFKAGLVTSGFSGSPLWNLRTQRVCGIILITLDARIDIGGRALSIEKAWEVLPKLKPQHRYTELTINWRDLCREQNRKLRRPATEEEFELEIFVPLGLMERKQQQRRPVNQEVEMDQVYGVEEKAEITRKFEHQEFLTYVGLGGKKAKNAKNVAIIGEPGAGKTTLLANLAQVIDENQGLAICISLGSFGAWQSLEPKRNLKDYLEQKWLEDALPDKNVSAMDRVALADRFRQGGVWLLLDGLDEMQSSSPVEALICIEKEVRSGYLQKARVVLTCRVNVWDANLSNPLREFETYKTLDFAEGQRDDFIRQWFTKKGNLALGEGLIAKLKESGRERICELVKNPLRLVLLCYIWTQQAGELPETKAQFYQRYLRYFYEWKKEVRDLTGKRQQQAQLHQALGRLAIAGIESSSRYRLSESLAVQEMGEDCFQLAVDLGWLNIVDREQGTDEAVYAFFHPTFQEFFAACGVEDWDFFLPRDHVDRPVGRKVYRIFEAKWKEVILLWLGRGDVKEAEKEVFIEALIEFQDSLQDFYFYRAYYLAAAGISEFKCCSLADEIVNQIIRWGLGYFEPETEEWTTFLDLIAESARDILPETDRSRAITALINLLSSPHEFTRNLAAEILGRIGQGNQEAITALMNILFYPDTDEYTCWQALQILGQVGQVNKEIISVLIDFICFSSNKELCIEAIRSLGKIGQANREVITDLIKLIDLFFYDEKKLCIEAIRNLGEIGQGNRQAITALINLIRPSHNDLICFSNKGSFPLQVAIIHSLGEIGQEDQEVVRILRELISNNNRQIRGVTAYSLGVMNPNDKEATSTLIDLMISFDDDDTWWSAACILGKIWPGNEEAITILIEKLCFFNDDDTWWKIADCLGVIEQGNEKFITTLINLAYASDNDDIWWKVICTLEKVAQGNRAAIKILIDIIHSSKGKNIRIKAVEGLGKIGKRSSEAFTTLINLICLSNDNNSLLNDNDCLRAALWSLYNIGIVDKKATTALMDLIRSSNDDKRRINIIKYLGEIGQGNEEIIAELIKLLHSSTDDSIRRQAAKSLEEIVQKEKMRGVVIALKDDLSDETYDNHVGVYRNCAKVLWKCAQTLSYPEFYQAWYSK